MTLFEREPRLVPYFGYRNTHGLRIEARALRNREPRWDHSAKWRKIRALLDHFASREEPRLPVTLLVRSPDGITARYEGVTNDEGFVAFDIALDNWPMPPTTRWETVEFHWATREGPQRADGFVLAPGTDTDRAIISDIDDTIIETGVTGGLRSVLRNWNRLLAQMPAERTAVPGVDTFYGALAGGGEDGAHTGEAGAELRATRHPFFYVSSSPWNLFSYLVTFMKTRGLPVGPIHLRDWGFNRATLGSSSHGTHKVDAIDRILAFYPEKRVLMIGDDTQGDLVAFSHVAAHNPGRVAAIFIRMAGDTHSPEEQAAKKRIADAGVPLWTGSAYDGGQAFLEEIGLAHDGEAERIVAAAERNDKKSAAI
ncbi:App1 family protein [Croceicoccus sp. YJ47]|uniref:phosphatase domain-containing protein n=1 Tax=Croceicoccus sp. YJ47 TaxID=2798724 RepID=UPI001924506F|nr:App1 family protein [Croceicoccus sp. YJ47]QQN74697.1 App1 family protein [Croceicoccus sp. YJ47]